MRGSGAGRRAPLLRRAPAEPALELPPWVLALLALGIAVGSGMIAVGVARSPSTSIYPELVKSGAQLVVVVVFGGILTAAWKSIEAARDRRQAEADAARERREMRREKQLRLFVRLVESYNEIKAVKRILRSYGFVDGTGALDARQVDGFREQMLRLNDVQLAVEALKREIGEARQFDDESDAIVAELYKVDRYLNAVVTFWERHGSEIDIDTDISVVANGLRPLIDDHVGYRNNITVPRREATELMQNVLIGPSEEVERSRRFLDRHEHDDDPDGGAARP